MKLIPRLGILALFIFSFQSLFSQSASVDSLKQLLGTHISEDTVRVNLLIDLANILAESNADLSFRYAQDAKEISGEINYKKGSYYALNKIGHYYLAFQSNHTEAMQNFFEGLKFAEEIKDSIFIANSFRNIGGVYLQQKNLKKALLYLKKSLNLFEKTTEKEKTIGVLFSLADCYSDMNNFGDAMATCLKGRKIAQEINDIHFQGVFLYFIADLNFKMQHREAPITDYLKSIELFEIEKNYRWLVWVHSRVSLLYSMKNDTVNAFKHIRTAISLGKEKNLKKELADSYEALAEIYFNINDYKKGHEYYVKYITWRDSAINSQSSAQIENLEKEYDQKKLEVLQEAEQEKQEQQKKIYVGSGIFLLLLTGGLFAQLRYVRKSKRELEKKSKQIAEEKEIAERERQRAEQSERFKQQFLANMSHEIRTPMNGVMGMTNILLEKDPKPEQIKFLNTIKKSSENLLVIVNDILDLSKMEAGKMEVEKIDFLLSEVVETVNQTLQHKIEEKGLSFHVDYDNSIPEIIVGDPTRINQILINIIGNAIKFTEKGSVKLKIYRHGNNLQFIVADTGIGMTKEQQEKVFEVFQQAEKHTSRKFGGTGLGLSISKKLIELQGGSITIESEKGAGTSFFITIPFEQSGKKQIVRKETEITAEMLKGLDGIKILLAEDNEYNREVAIETLSLKLKDIKIDCAVNGAEVIEKLHRDHYDIVLMDVQMPILDGYETTQKIRKELQSDIPVIALTASVIRSDISKCLEAGMNGYVPKPFKTHELFSAMITALKGRKISAATVQRQVTDLTFLREFCEGDEVRMKKYIDMYLNAAPKNLEIIKEAHVKEDYATIQKTVHQLKAHLGYMGMAESAKLADEIEQRCNEKTNLDNLPLQISSLEASCKTSFTELC